MKAGTDRRADRAVARGPRLADAATVVTVAAMLAAAAGPAVSCGGIPPPPFCGKTVSLSQALPGSQVLTGGGVLTVPIETFLQLTSFGGAACPPAPVSAKVTVTVTCPITGVSMNMVTFVIAPGYTPTPVPVPIPPGPARVCSLSASVVVTFSDGTAITTTAADKDICIVDPAPGNPAVARLDIQHVGPAVVHVHPGDQGRLRYRVTNNDPTHAFSGTVVSDSEGSTRLVSSTGVPEAPGNGPFTISDPTEGDNFNLMFGPIPPPGCVPLPPDPGAPLIPVVSTPIVIGPGQSRVIDVFLRPWGMCANGSCSKSRVRLDGMFADGTSGLACTAGAVIADTGAAPVYQWLDGGAVPMPTASPPFCVFPHRPNPDLNTQFRAGAPLAGGAVNGQPFTMIMQPKALGGLGRFDGMANFPPMLQSFFDVFFEVELAPLVPGHTLNFEGLGVAPGVPHGFSQHYPMGMGTLRHRGPTTAGAPRVVDSFFDVFYQVSLDGVRQDGSRRALTFTDIQMMPTPIPGRARIQGTAVTSPSDEGDGGIPYVAMAAHLDVRGFSRPGNFLFCPGDTNGDAMVTFPDLNQVLSQFGQLGAGLAGDIDGDNDVDFQDLNYVLSNFGRNCGPTF